MKRLLAISVILALLSACVLTVLRPGEGVIWLGAMSSLVGLVFLGLGLVQAVERASHARRR